MADKSPPEIRVDLFKAYLEDLGRVGGRHETLRQFYLSVISALATILGLAGKDGILKGVHEAAVVVGLVGVLIGVAWFLHMGRFADIFSAKGETLEDLESDLPAKLFTTERAKLKGGQYLRLTSVDQVVAFCFIVLFAALAYMKRGT
jgi:hypothetical protein